jgi:hypothetical protein
MISTDPLTRRTTLRGLGATLCLPMLECIGTAKTAAADATPPKRLLFLSYGWGVAKDDWFPKETGPDYELPASFKYMERHRKDFSILSNLSNKNATQAHWGTTTWLTSADVTATPGKKFQNTISVDQLAARVLGKDTRFTSLPLAGPKESNNDGGFGPGLSLSWSDSGNPIAGETNPLGLFDRLFGAGEVPLEERRYQLSKQRSVLDAILHDAKSLQPKLSSTDRDKVEEYFQSVREIEVRLDKADEWLDKPKPKAPFPRPEGKPSTAESIKLTYDLMVAAIQTDMTRVITYRQPTEGLFPELGFKIEGHKTTHTRKGQEPYNAALARDQKQLELVAYLIDKLKALKDVDGTSVFHNTLIAYGGGITINHDVRDTPTMVAGYGGGGLNQGQHYRYESNQTPLANLWYSMLRQVGYETDRFMDSDGKLSGLFG